MIFKARVRNGRIVLDEPTDLPEGAEVELFPVSQMTGDEREALERALAESQEDVEGGRLYSAAQVLDELRRQ